MTNKSKLKNLNDYEIFGNDYKKWIDKADDLMFSSDVLKKKYFGALNKIKKKKSGIFPRGYRCESSMLFLRAMAVELYLKALFLKGGGKLVKHGKYIGPKRHNLINLTKKYTKISLGVAEIKVLERLSSVLNFWGRYPVPLSSSDWRKKIKEVEGVQPIYVWNFKDLEVLNKFLKEKIGPELKPNSDKVIKYRRIK